MAIDYASKGWAAGLALALVCGCGGQSPRAEDGDEVGTSLYALVEQLDGVALLPPLGPDPGASTSFDATLLDRLTVELDAIAPSGDVTALAAFNAYSSPILQRKDDHGVYFVDVPASRYISAGANRTYRFRVLLDGRELARSDLSGQIFDALVKNPAVLIGVKVHVDVRPAPSISTLAPATVAVGAPTTTITLRGAAFMHDSTVLTGDRTLASTWLSSSALAVTVPADLLATARLLPIHVVTPAPGGGASSDATLTVESPAPILSSVAPDGVIVGASDTPITVLGSDFLEGATVTLDGAALTTGWISSSTLIAIIPAASLATAGTHAIAVGNPAPGQPSAGTLAFTVSNPLPVLTRVTPASATAGGAALTIGLDGSSFLPGATATFGGVPLPTTFVSSTHLTAIVPPVLLAGAGTFGVAVTNPTPSATSAGVAFTVENPQPTIVSLSPSSTLVGSTDTLITIIGQGFAVGANAFIDGTPLTTGYVSGYELIALVSSIDLAVAKTSAITVENPAPTGAPSAPATFTIANPRPVISALSTTSLGGSTGTLTVLGSSFVSGAVVSLDGAAVATTFVSSTRLDAVIAATVAGGNHVVIVSNPTPSYGASAPSTFQLLNPQPTATSVTPASATAGAASTTITINGASFVNGVSAIFDGTALATTRVSSTQLTAVVPATQLASGRVVTVLVTNPEPSQGIGAPLTFTVNNAVPTLSSVAPTSIPGGGSSATITLTGAGFVSGAVATIASADLGALDLTTTFVTSSQLQAVVPASYLDTARALTVTVRNPSPTTGSTGALSLSVVAPSITSVTPSPATLTLPAGTITLTLDGSGFTTQSPRAELTLGGVVQRVAATSVSESRIIASFSGLTLGGTATIRGGWQRADGTYVWGASTSVTLYNPIPSLTSSSPSTFTAASGDTTLTITGTNFTSGTQVLLDGVLLPLVTWTPTQLTVAVSASSLANGRLANLTATNPTPTLGTSAALTLTINNPVPTITALTPPRSMVNTAVTLTIDGTGFVPASVASFAGTTLTTTFVSSTRLTATVPATLTATWNRYAVVVTSGTPAGGASALRYFVVRPTTSNALTVATGGGTTCNLRTNGTVWCVGLNSSGQVGNNSTTSPITTPAQVTGITSAVQVGSGNNVQCARLADGTMRCWGPNTNGQLGNNSTTLSRTPVVVSGLNDVADFSAGDSNVCARKTDGTVWCWGDNSFGQLGDGTATRRLTPVQVSGISTAIGISVGYRDACALLDDGTAWCWGGTSGVGSVPVQQAGVSEAVMVKLRTYTRWFVLADSTMMGAGSNVFGQLLDGTVGSSVTTPVALPGLANVSLFTGSENSACATLRDGTTWCWGGNAFGQLAQPVTCGGCVTIPPVQVAVTNVSEITGGLLNIMLRRTDGTLRAWGSGANYQLGNGNTTNQTSPVTVTF